MTAPSPLTRPTTGPTAGPTTGPTTGPCGPAPGEVWSDVRNHIETEARVLTWIQADRGEDAGDPDQARQPELVDLDSFTFIQLVLSLEAAYSLDLLEDLGEFSGTCFDDVATFVAERVERRDRAADTEAP